MALDDPKHQPREAARSGAVDGWLRAIARFALWRPWTLTLVGLALLVATAPAAVALYTDLRTDLRELLPRGAPAAVALEALEKRVGGFGLLAVMIETPDLKAGERFADAIGDRLTKRLVPTMAREVRWRTDDDMAYVHAHGALHVDLGDLEDLDLGLAAEIEARTARAAGFDLGLDDPPDGGARTSADAIDPRLDRVTKKLEARSKEQDHFLDGYLAGDDGHALAVLILPPEGTTSLDYDRRLRAAVDEELAAVPPKSFDPRIRIGYAGEVIDVIEAQEHLVQDLALSGVLVFVAVGGVIIGFYRSFRAIPLLVLPLSVGTAVAFAAGKVGIGYLNPNTAFLGSIILGNGINAGIILLARYLEERRSGASVDDALPTALTSTWRATATASGAATVSYAALGVTGFRGFNQFAFLGGLGMTLVWLATYVFMAPLLVLFERLRPLAKAAPARHAGAATPRGGPVARRVAAVVERFAGPIALTGLAATVAGGVLVARFAQDPIEYDFTKLGSRQGAIDGGTYWGKRLDIVMQSYLTPTVILTDTDASAAQVERALTAEKEAEGPDGPIDRVITLATVLPDDQARKIEVLRRIKGRLTDRWVKRIPEANRAAVDELRRTTKLTPVSVDDLPDHIGRLFKEKDGRTGRLVLVYPKVSVGSSHGRRQIDFVRGVRRSALKTDPAAQVAGSLILSADIIESITKDGFLATSLSFTAVTWLTLLILRSARSAAWVVGSLSMGTLWMGGALGLFGIKLNFVNFAVLPITFGIGIDYAVNLYERYRQTGPGGAPEALATSGGAIALCSLTTIIGYSALLVADNRAIFSFGLTAVLGEVTCLSAALLALPALLIVRDRRAARRDRS